MSSEAGSDVVSVEAARPDEAVSVAAAVTELLRELRSDATLTVPGIERAATELLAGGRGGVLVGHTVGNDQPIGILGYSFQEALRLAGTYCAIQELWVASAYRSRGVGTQLVQALQDECARRGIHRIEVCLPQPGSADFGRTRNFYDQRGFRPLGPRLVRDLP